MVLVPLEDYESLLLSARAASKPRGKRPNPRPTARLLKLLEAMRRERGSPRESSKAFLRRLAGL